MIVNNHFVFIHLHKTAGTFFNSFITQFFPGSAMVGYHFPKRMTPLAFQGLPCLGLVRNPWEFYVSWFSFQMQKERSNPVFMITSRGKTLDFPSTLERLLSLHQDADLLGEVVRQLPVQFGRSGFNVPAPAMQGIEGTGLGFYGFLYAWMYGGTKDAPTVVRTDDMLDGLGAFFNEANIAMTQPMQAFLQGQAHQNTSTHRPYRSYYDERLAALVAQVDHAVIAQHSYTF